MLTMWDGRAPLDMAKAMPGDSPLVQFGNSLLEKLFAGGMLLLPVPIRTLQDDVLRAVP